jgi:N-acetylglutamate synthase-like GNAT family acetyltransferase
MDGEAPGPVTGTGDGSQQPGTGDRGRDPGTGNRNRDPGAGARGAAPGPAVTESGAYSPAQQAPGLSVRDARGADSDAIAELIGELGYPAAGNDVRRRMRAHESRDGGRLLVVEAAGEVVGFASIHFLPLIHYEQPLCRITAFVVSLKLRRKGVGRTLLDAIEAIAREGGCARVEVTSNDRRTDAHAFYQGLGYEMASKRFVKTL